MKLKYVAFMLSIILGLSAMAQRRGTTEFTPDGLVEELTEHLSKSTSDSGKQKEMAKTVKDFQPVYESMDGALQKRVTDFYNYAVKAKLKGYPELNELTRVLTAYGQDADGRTNLEGFVQVLEALKKKSAKSKGVSEFLDFASGLLSERTLYRSNSVEWRFAKDTPFRLGVAKGEPMVWFDTPADLFYASSKDHGVIHGTKGRYRYRDNDFRGEGGRVDWTRTGIKADECYADLGRYRVETKFPKFKADSVQFVNTNFFPTPILGRVEESLGNVQEPGKYSYPRFRSHQENFVMKDLLPGVDYSGCFMMNGAKFITNSSKGASKLVFNHEGKVRLTVTSAKFTITPQRVTADNAMVAFYLGDEDSLSCNGVQVRYSPNDHRVTLVNDPKRNYYSPYIDSYHQMDIFSESVTWRMDKNDLVFSSLGTQGSLSTSSFESSNCYTYNRFHEITGIDQVSPVKRVYDYAQMAGYHFAVQDFANFINMDVDQALLMVHNLSKYGLVTYNEITQKVNVNDKLVDYEKAYTKSKGFDYDAIALESSTRGENARIDLTTDSLLIRGVNRFVVSDTQQVIVYPDSATGYRVSVGRNRSMRFDGRITVGRFILSVKDCAFDYESYRFNMPKITNFVFYVPDRKEPDKLEQLIRTPLTDLVGSLTVDKADNHCGLTKNKEYPIFESTENSHVFYDRPEIQKRQYKRETFYYSLHPFSIKSLNDIAVDSMKFNGVLTSAGIFPDIEEPLKVQPDYYLGFKIETPADGLPTYGGKGKYTNTIRLDHHGLRGKGALDYLTSHSTSKEYLFLPDSMVAMADTITVREEQGYPDAKAGRTSVHWLPYADSMAVVTVEGGRPFRMYRGETTFRGRLDLMLAGAAGAGTADVRDGSLASNRFTMSSTAMDATVSTFVLRSTTFNDVAFSATNVSSHVDYDQHTAEIKSLSGPQITHLPLVKYDAWPDHLTWMMERQELVMANSTRPSSEGLDGLDLRQRIGKLNDMPGVRFESTDVKQKKLAYNSLQAVYRYNRGDLSSQGVYLISVADAAIAPGADSVHVTMGGAMTPLKNASLVCDRANAYHLIYNADLTIESAASYSGKGNMDYIDDLKKRHRLTLNEIKVNETGVTIANGAVGDGDNFTLSSAFGFAGKVRAEGNKQWLFFEGGVRLLQPCIAQDNLGLLAYADYTDPEHVHVTVPEHPTDWQGKPLTASILMDKNTLQPRAAFLTKERPDGNELLAAHGVLTYFGDTKQYMIASEEKIAQPDLIVAPYLAMNTTDCTVDGEGPVSFTMMPSQASFFAYGVSSIGIQSHTDDHLNTVFGVRFPVNADLVNSLGQNIKEELRLAPIGMSTNAEMRHALMHLLGADRGAAAYNAFSLSGTIDKMPEQMASTFLFDNIRWEYKAGVGLYYNGKVGLVAVGDKQIGAVVRLKARIYMNGRTERMEIYVECAKDHWYLLSYDLEPKLHTLTIYSSMGTWVDQIKAIPMEQRTISKEGMPDFKYRTGSRSNAREDFLQEFSRLLGDKDDDE